jgi:hypothetical protein
MVNPACLIAIDAGVDDRPVFEGKEKGMMRMLRVVRRKILRRLPGNAFAGVFNNAGPLANSTGGKDSLAVKLLISASRLTSAESVTFSLLPSPC